jgi:hypothetical protein
MRNYRTLGTERHAAPPHCDPAFLIGDIEVNGTICGVTAVGQLPAGPTGSKGKEKYMPQSSTGGSST